MPNEIVWIADSKTDTVQQFVDNGVFCDGRKKTSDGDCNRTTAAGTKISGIQKDSSPTKTKNIAGFTIEESHHCNQWMKR